MKYKGYALVIAEVEADDDKQAREKIADKLGDDYFSWFDPDEIVLYDDETKEVVEEDKACNRCWHNCQVTEPSEYCDKCATKNRDGSYTVSYSQFECVDGVIERMVDEGRFTRTNYATANEIRQAMGLKVENDPRAEMLIKKEE